MVRRASRQSPSQCNSKCALSLSLVYSPAGNVHLKQLELKEDVLVRRPTPTL